ncbi:LCT [Branchiostoma lanceolatum]|uniref:LCT protein n=1 Tax=Branchiostoma lanceolatum TaxID=7740 RepID=A0A8K0EUJ9_BRALA|nr:LCT [Branchiostoma lanceolatum]
MNVQDPEGSSAQPAKQCTVHGHSVGHLKMKWLVLLALLFLTAGLCSATPTPCWLQGADESACAGMMLTRATASPQTTPSPYRLSADYDKEHHRFNVRVAGDQFRSVLLQARRPGSTEPVGTFLPPSQHSGLKRITCSSQGDTITNRRPLRTNEVRLTWEMPEGERKLGEIYFVATVVRRCNRYWVGVQSESVAELTRFIFWPGSVPEGYLWSTATASYQIEGAWNRAGKGESMWDHYAHSLGAYEGDEATKSYDYAFDLIHRGKLMNILQAYGVPEKLVTAIGATYSQTWAKVRTPDGDTETFQILAGVLQGDTLAPFLFVVALDYALRCAIDGREEQLGFTLKRRASRRVPARTVTDFDFADDLALISDTAERACILLAEVERHCRRIGLQLNAKKTKVMAYNTTDEKVTSLDGTQLEVVKDFRYLGGWIASTAHDIRVRRALAWSTLHSMRRVWESNMDNKLKRRLFVSTVECVLLYGSETWTLTVQDERSLDGMYTRMLRKVLNVTWEDRITNSVLYGDLPRLSQKIRHRRMALAGHCVRHTELTASQLILWEPTDGRRKRGRRRTTLIDNLKRDAGLSDISTTELRSLMEDRTEWSRRTHCLPR